MEQDAFTLFESGDLKGAVQAAVEVVRNSPTNTANRFFLAELLCFSGAWERADKQLDVIGRQDSETQERCNLIRQLIRAELAREMLASEGRVPDLVSDPSESIRLCLDLSVAVRDNDSERASDVLEQLDAVADTVRGSADGRDFEGLRDLDDLTSCFFEVMTSTGKYFWVPFNEVTSIDFRPPQNVGDLLWRSAQISVAGGMNGEVYLPVRYVNSCHQENAAVQLGRETTWSDPADGPVRGFGQREFLLGDDVVSILELKQIDFQIPTAEAPEPELGASEHGTSQG